MKEDKLKNLKEKWEQEEGGLNNELNEIVEKSKAYVNVYLVKPSQFARLEEIAPLFNGHKSENLEAVLRAGEPNHFCENCNPQFSCMVIPKEHSRDYNFIAPVKFSHFTFYIKLDLKKEAIFREVKNMYNEMLGVSQIRDKFGFSTDKRINLFMSNKSRLLDLMELGLKKKSYQCRIVKKYLNYQATICQNCEEKGAVEKMREDTLNQWMNYLSILGFKGKDYQANLIIKKEKVW